jgi:hypothetical protein
LQVRTCDIAVHLAVLHSMAVLRCNGGIAPQYGGIIQQYGSIAPQWR